MKSLTSGIFALGAPNRIIERHSLSGDSRCSHTQALDALVLMMLS